jgi:alpha-glucoside transport system permease protein
MSGDVIQQIVGAAFAIVIALATCVAYFWGTNWLLDKVLNSSDQRISNEESVVREKRRSQIRPWLFLLPALLFLSIYLIYPVIETFRLSFFDKTGRTFVGFSNYTWAFGDAAFRQSIFNNALWLIIVPAFATAFGLIIAVLADRLWWGNIAKSLVFLPMAISFVGASVIWKFVYDFAGEGNEIGLLNALVGAFGLPPQNWITMPFWNSVFLMVILIWIQTGFAMVILSAALRGVPEETLEAARIDGASNIRIFFDIMVPQIWGTIVVVWTTITIVVLKVFDIIYAMTNGQWDTEVLANLMYRWMFVSFDNGRGAAIAVILMLAVTPIMIWNIRRANGEEGTR